jgi:hypothetical protein
MSDTAPAHSFFVYVVRSVPVAFMAKRQIQLTHFPRDNVQVMDKRLVCVVAGLGVGDTQDG